MCIRRNAALVGVGLCLLVAGGCRTVIIGDGRDPHVVTGHPGPPPHAPAHGWRAKHEYRYYYYPEEQVYFDPGRGVYFYLDGPYWSMSASLPGHLHVRHSPFVTIEMEYERPYREFERHKRRYPRHYVVEREGPEVVIGSPGPPAHAPAHGHRAKHRQQYRYRYYPAEQVYFDPGRRVYFYLDGSNWSMGASLPVRLELSHSRFVTIETEYETPYLEFEEHKSRYPKHKGRKKKKRKKKKDWS